LTRPFIVRVMPGRRVYTETIQPLLLPETSVGLNVQSVGRYTSDGRGRGGVVVVGHAALLYKARCGSVAPLRRRRRSFISCFQWSQQTPFAFVTKQWWPAGIGLVSDAVSAIPIPNRDRKYRPDTDAEYWYRSKPNEHRDLLY